MKNFWDFGSIARNSVQYIVLMACCCLEASQGTGGYDENPLGEHNTLTRGDRQFRGPLTKRKSLCDMTVHDPVLPAMMGLGMVSQPPALLQATSNTAAKDDKDQVQSVSRENGDVVEGLGFSAKLSLKKDTKGPFLMLKRDCLYHTDWFFVQHGGPFGVLGDQTSDEYARRDMPSLRTLVGEEKKSRFRDEERWAMQEQRFRDQERFRLANKCNTGRFQRHKYFRVHSSEGVQRLPQK